MRKIRPASAADRARPQRGTKWRGVRAIFISGQQQILLPPTITRCCRIPEVMNGCGRADHAGASGTHPVGSPAESVRGDDASGYTSQDDPAWLGGDRVFVFCQSEADGLAGAAWQGGNAGACRIAAAAAGVAQLQHPCDHIDFACRHSRRRRAQRAAQLRGQGRQSGIADSAERRYRLDRVARSDHGDRRTGRAVAGDAADRNPQRHGLAVVEGHRRGRRRARQPARRQRRQADRQRQHQGAERQRRDQGQRHLHVAAQACRGLACRTEPDGAGQPGRQQPFGGGSARQRSGPGQAADRQDRRRPGQRGGGAAAQRSHPAAGRPGAMGQGLPLDSAARHRRGLVAAAALAGAAADPRDSRNSRMSTPRR